MRIFQAPECFRIGVCERCRRRARRAASPGFRRSSRPPQFCMRADGRSIQLQEGRSEREARLEFENSAGVIAAEQRAGAARLPQGRPA
jgi:hypothetical protein